MFVESNSFASSWGFTVEVVVTASCSILVATALFFASLVLMRRRRQRRLLHHLSQNGHGRARGPPPPPSPEAQMQIHDSSASSERSSSVVAEFRDALEAWYRSRWPTCSVADSYSLTYGDFPFELTDDDDDSPHAETTTVETRSTTIIDELLRPGEWTTTTSRRRARKVFFIRGCHKALTTLCFQMANAWARRSGDDDSYRLVIVVQLQQLRGSTLEQHLRHRLLGARHWAAVTSTADETLFILDGLDRLPPHLERSVLALIAGRQGMFTGASFIVTSHRPLPRALRHEHQRLFTRRLKLRDSWQEEAVAKVAGHAANAIVRLLGKGPQERRASPLLVSYVAAAAKNDALPAAPKDEVHLYRVLVAFLVRRWKASRASLSTDNNVVDLDRHVTRLLTKFERFALKILDADWSVAAALRESQPFTPDEMNDIISLGFLTGGECSGPRLVHLKAANDYELADESLVEFVAAHHLWRTRSDEETLDRFVAHLHNVRLLDQSRSRFTRFLFGLFRDEQHLAPVLRALRPFAHYYACGNFRRLWRQVEKTGQTTMTPELRHVLDPFVPRCLGFGAGGAWSCSPSSLLLGCDAFKRSDAVILWDPRDPLDVGETLKLHKLHVQLNETIAAASVAVCRLIQCRQVVFEVMRLNHDEWGQLVAMAGAVRAGALSFALRSSSTDATCSFVSRKLSDGVGLPAKTAIKSVTLLCSLDHRGDFKALADLLRTRRVESVYCEIAEAEREGGSPDTTINQADVDALVESVANNASVSEFVCRVGATSKTFTVDLQRLSAAESTSRAFDVLWLEGNIACTRNATSEVLILETQGDVLRQTLLSSGDQTLVVGASLSAIHSIAEDETRTECRAIKELDVTLTDDLWRRDNYFLCVKELCNLQKLCVELDEGSREGPDLLEAVARDVANVVKYLPYVECFEVRHAERNVPLATAIVQKLAQHCLANERKQTTGPQLATLRLHVLDAGDCRTLAAWVVEPLRRHRLETLDVIVGRSCGDGVGSWDAWNIGNVSLVLARLFPWADGFRIAGDIDGRRDGSSKSKVRYLHSFYDPMFTVNHAK